MNFVCVFVLFLFVDKVIWKVIYENCLCCIIYYVRFMNEKFFLSNEKNCYYFFIYMSEENY